MIWNGERFNYRQVRWDEETRAYANLAANKMGGTWDKKLLKNFDKGVMLKAGFKKSELGVDKGNMNFNNESEYPFAKELDYMSQYVVLRFDRDIDWNWIKEVFGLESVYSKRANGKPWSKGIGRVVDGMEAIKKLKDSL